MISVGGLLDLRCWLGGDGDKPAASVVVKPLVEAKSCRAERVVKLLAVGEDAHRERVAPASGGGLVLGNAVDDSVLDSFNQQPRCQVAVLRFVILGVPAE